MRPCASQNRHAGNPAGGLACTESEKISPDYEGGFTASESVTGFDGQTHISMVDIGAGHGGKARHDALLIGSAGLAPRDVGPGLKRP